jgi:hypothetical protein
VKAMVGTSERELKKNYRHLYKELEESSDICEPDSESLGELEAPLKKVKIGKIKVDKGRSYDPSVIDFLQRCSTNEEAIEIISYLEKRGEITAPYAESLRKKVATKGVRSFGPKRELGYYHNAFD